MRTWDKSLLNQFVDNASFFDNETQAEIIKFLNENIDFTDYQQQNADRLLALEQLKQAKETLKTHNQVYPTCYHFDDIDFNPENLRSTAYFFTAGGEGQRLITDLSNKMSGEALEHFTKATFPLEGFPENVGPLMVNLKIIKDLSDKYGFQIPVVITLGPKGSMTYDYIPNAIKEFDNFGLENLYYISQGKRLHLTDEGKITVFQKDGEFQVSTNPDESGGPFLSFAKDDELKGTLRDLGVKKLLCIQGGALYNPKLISNVASLDSSHDAYVVGLARQTFPENDPFGTLMILEKDGEKSLRIMEAHMINSDTRKLRNPEDTAFLPANSGIYVLNLKVFDKAISAGLPFYATSSKGIENSEKSAPKIGFAATDFPRFGENPAVLIVNTGNYAILKDMTSLDSMQEIAERFKLREYFR